MAIRRNPLATEKGNPFIRMGKKALKSLGRPKKIKLKKLYRRVKKVYKR